MSIGTRIKECRKKLGITQTELATKAGTTRHAIQKIESGITSLPRNIEELANSLNVSVGWLLSGQEASSNTASIDLSAKEFHLLSSFITLPERDKELVLAVIARLAEANSNA